MLKRFLGTKIRDTPKSADHTKKFCLGKPIGSNYSKKTRHLKTINFKNNYMGGSGRRA
jgi:hypothetical protein